MRANHLRAHPPHMTTAADFGPVQQLPERLPIFAFGQPLLLGYGEGY